jgi:hypothetical protein
MLLCLYVLPKFDGYKVTTNCNFYKEKCYSTAVNTHKIDAAGAAGICSALTACGLRGTPCKVLEPTCSLTAAYNGTVTMPNELIPAMCFSATKCPQHTAAAKVMRTLDTDYVNRVEKDMKRALSVLFNAFIFGQVSACCCLNQVPVASIRFPWPQSGSRGLNQVPVDSIRFPWPQSGFRGLNQVPVACMMYVRAVISC